MNEHFSFTLNSFMLAIHSLRVWTIKGNKPKQSKNPLEMDKNLFELLPAPSPSLLIKVRFYIKCTHTDTHTSLKDFHISHSYSAIKTIIKTPRSKAIISFSDCPRCDSRSSSGMTETVAM